MKTAGRFRYVTDCIHADGDDINDMTRASTRITLEAFRRAVGPEEWSWVQFDLGYDRNLPISKDQHVGYYKSKYRGAPAYYLSWSGIEHVFTLNGN